MKPGARFQSSFFSERTWGYGTGKQLEEDGFVDIPEGPIAGTGFCLFMRRDRIPEVFAQFMDLEVERVSCTLQGEKQLLEQYVVTCRK